MKLVYGAATDIGRARERNEDSYLAEEPLFAVADGMGGHRGGDVASSLALETLRALVDSGAWERLPDQVREANRVVFARSEEDHALAGMGTTLTAVVARDGEIRLVHVGDSRAYLLRDGRFRMLTEDHTLVQRMVNEGRLSQAEAGVHPQRSILTRALGVEEEVPVDEASVEVRPGDRLLLCTDGLTGMVRDETIQEILEANPDAQQAAEKLVEAANRAGGLDNITAVILDFREDGEAAGGPGESSDRVAAPPSPPGFEPVPAAAVREDRAEQVSFEAARKEAEARWTAGPRRRWRRPLVWVLAALLVLGAAYLGVRLYVDRQWFVGVDQGRVAIFNGIPTEVLGFELHRVVERTSLPAEEASELAPWSGLDDGITVDSREEAEAIVDRIAEDLRQQRQQDMREGPGA